MAANMTEVLRVYRAGLRVAKRFPHVPIRDKLRFLAFMVGIHESFYIVACRYNVREFVEVYRYERDSVKVQELISTGKENVKTLEQLSLLDSRTWSPGWDNSA